MRVLGMHLFCERNYFALFRKTRSLCMLIVHSWRSAGNSGDWQDLRLVLIRQSLLWHTQDGITWKMLDGHQLCAMCCIVLYLSWVSTLVGWEGFSLLLDLSSGLLAENASTLRAQTRLTCLPIPYAIKTASNSQTVSWYENPGCYLVDFITGLKSNHMSTVLVTISSRTLILHKWIIL